MNDKCDKCKNDSPARTMWFAYRFSCRIALCNDCYNEAGRPKDYSAMRKWLEEVALKEA
jgi:hypothetical protein